MKKLIALVAAMVMVTGYAYAADWNFYGSARVSTFYTSTDIIGGPESSDDQYEQGLQSNARIGATVKVSDELTGGFEYGASGGKANIRKLYGEWNFGSGSFLVGQTYTPLNWFYSDQVFDGDADMLPYGGIYSGREDMLRLKIGGLQVALLGPKLSTTGAAPTSTETTIPAIEVVYTLKLDMATLKFGGGYQSYEATVGTNSVDVDSYVIAFGANASFGAFYIGGNVYTGQNAGNMISIDTDADRGWDDGLANLTATGVIDNDTVGAMIAAGFKLNDMINFEAGYGYAEEELDTAGSVSDEVSSYYLNATITLAPGVFFVPEIGKIDGEEAGDDEVDYFGVKWQINF